MIEAIKKAGVNSIYTESPNGVDNFWPELRNAPGV